MKVLLIGSEGYAGSYLSHSLSKKYDFDFVDLNWFHGNQNPKDFRDLPADYLNSFSAIVLLAGHSSVKMCENNRKSSFNNNVRNFVEILDKLKGVKLVYASSSSVYVNTGKKVVDENYFEYVPNTYYDITKQIVDMYASKSDVEYYGLRFGTINGWSPRLRKDIMINAMVYNSMNKGQIELYSKHINRAILGIKDLSSAIEKILDCKSDHRGIYNLASFNASAEEIAYKVAEIMNVPVIEKEDSAIGTYDFAISTEKFSKTFDYHFSEDIYSITKSLEENMSSCETGDRNKAIKYE